MECNHESRLLAPPGSENPVFQTGGIALLMGNYPWCVERPGYDDPLSEVVFLQEIFDACGLRLKLEDAILFHREKRQKHVGPTGEGIKSEAVGELAGPDPEDPVGIGVNGTTYDIELIPYVTEYPQ